jgi:hypothetical protein
MQVGTRSTERFVGALQIAEGGLPATQRDRSLQTMDGLADKRGMQLMSDAGSDVKGSVAPQFVETGVCISRMADRYDPVIGAM